MTLDRSEYIDRFYFRLPDIHAFLRRLKDELLAHPSKADVPSSAEGCGCISKITQKYVSELWKSMLPEDIPEDGRRILSRISMFLYTFVLNCYCTMPGYHEKVVINPAAYGFLQKYFFTRAEYISNHHSAHTALFPGGYAEENGALQGNTIRAYVQKVSDDIDVKFDLRDCRRTYGQNLLDMGADIETVSKMLGHARTTTTEKCYCSLNQDAALEKASEIFACGRQVKRGGITTDAPKMPIGFDIIAPSPSSTPVNGGMS